MLYKVVEGPDWKGDWRRGKLGDREAKVGHNLISLATGVARWNGKKLQFYGCNFPPSRMFRPPADYVTCDL